MADILLVSLHCNRSRSIFHNWYELQDRGRNRNHNEDPDTYHILGKVLQSPELTKPTEIGRNDLIWLSISLYMIIMQNIRIFTFGVLGSAKDFTTASLPETSSCEVIPSFKEPSSSLSLRLLAFSCLPRQNGSSNLGNFFTRTVFSRFLPDLGVF